MTTINWARRGKKATHYFFTNKPGKERVSACNTGEKGLILDHRYEFLTHQQLREVYLCDTCKGLWDKVRG